MKTRIQFAKEFASNLHSGQLRADDITPYYVHVENVFNNTLSVTADETLLVAALLHDTVEDCGVTFNDIENLFGWNVASVVSELTNNNDRIAAIGKTAYMVEKMQAISSDALIVKLADRLDNVSDIKTARDEKWRKKYKMQTMLMLDAVRTRDDIDHRHWKIIEKIEEKIA